MRGPLAERARRVGPAVVSFPIVGAALVGDGVLAVVSRNLRPARVALVDLDGGGPARTAAIPTGDGAWGVAADGRGGLWLGMFGARGRANLYRVDLATLAVEAAAAIDAVHLWDLAVGADGVVYGVSDGRASLFAYDPRTRRATDLGVVRRGPEGARSVAVVGRTVVVGGRQEGGALLRAYDVDARTARSILPPALARHQIVYSLATDGDRLALGTRGPGERDPAVAVLDAARLDAPPATLAVARGEAVVDGLLVEGAATWATVRPSGALLRVDRGAGEPVRTAEPAPLAEQRGVFRSGGALVGAAADGRVWTVPDEGEAVVRDLVADGTVEGGPETVQSLAAADGRVWAGGTFGFARRDPDGALRRVAVPGEPKAIVDVGGTGYLALYPVGEVWEAPPDAPPRRLAALPRDENRPVALAAVAGGGALVVGTAADRTGGGGLHVVDLPTGALTSWRDPMGRQPVLAVAADGDRVLLGGREGTVVAWDPDAGAATWQLVRPVPGGGGVTGLAVADRSLHVLTAGGWHLLVDLDAGVEVARRQVGASGGGLAVARGAVFGVDADRLLGFPAAGGAPAVLLEGLAPRHWGPPTLAADGDALLVLHGSDVVRVVPDAGSGWAHGPPAPVS